MPQSTWTICHNSPWDEILVSAQTDLLLLLLLNMAFFMGAYMSFLRYDLME